MVKHKTKNGERECWRVPSKEMTGQIMWLSSGRRVKYTKQKK